MQFSSLTRLVAAAALAASTMFAPAAHAQGSQQYVAVNPPLPSDTPGKIEVLEFFAYTCPHCAVIEPMVEEWAKTKPDDVVLKQVPIAFNASMKPLQQLFYTLQTLNRPDLHAKVFNAMHNERKRLFDKKAMGDWVAEQGVDRAQFDSIFDSFSVQTQVQRADQLANEYKIEGTPSFAVGGKYITSPSLAGNSYEGALREIDRLIPMARAN
ncbi:MULTISPECIES: thiol:disulfide interchange protein DsbA/DsbL [unclassified Bordetella]|uniref:thiol:disulfide interchange protein DsbA/DsbL n=1 Tax=unclassified Bordetella TaxID=2630031 RepID=UPI0013219B19|nr:MULTISPECIES: thiol:disulfide interchange protein DsbA/DsbL [unclassified Bordetella]MVW72903.1 thioredoxin domain-containing protein [Bordetella sp. 15P40C-2]MVW78711.1 thioredoxin domain-containing protein [Bordetella sp. 02P26C-1]